MRFGSVCSGIEAASVAWGPLGWRAAWFSEIEPFPSAVLAHHYPETPNLGDMTKLPEMIRRGEVEAPELFCGGTPCQAFSVAGLRRSLDDARGNLSLTFCEIANAIDAVRFARGELPAVVFWENVPGVLSTADNAFGCFLAGLAGDDQPAVAPRGKWKAAGVVVGPERLAAWRVLDAQFFGVAQRRRRVFVVSVSLRHPRAWAIAESLLPLQQGVQRDPPARGKAPEGAARGAAEGAGVSQPYTVGNTLTARMHKGINTTLDEGQTPVLAFDTYNQTASDTAQTLCSRGDTPGGNAHLVPAVLAHALRGEGFDASEDGTGRGTLLVPVAHVDTMPTMLNGANTPAGHNARSGHTKDQYIVPVAHAFDARQSDVLQYGDKAGPLDTDGHSIGVVIGTDCYNGAITGDVAATLGTPGSSVNASGPTVMQTVAVRTANTSANGHGISADHAAAGYMVPVAVSEAGSIAATLRTGGNDHADVYNITAVAFRETADCLTSAYGTKWNGNASADNGSLFAAQPVAVDTYNGAITGDLAATISARIGIPDATGPRVMQAVLAPTLTASNDPSRSPQSSEITAQVAAVVQATAVAFDTYNQAVNAHTSQTIKSPQGAVQESVGTVLQAMQVRRLTPVECERLMGFPDSYTAIPWRGKPANECPDGPRYKALGNSWAVPVVRWIGERIRNGCSPELRQMGLRPF